MDNKLKITLLVLFVLAGAWAVYVLALNGTFSSLLMKFTSYKQTEYQVKMDSALSTHADKNFDAGIQEFEGLLKEASDPTEAAYLKNKLAINYLNRGMAQGQDNDDIKKAIDLLWSISFDTSVSAKFRAQTLADLATIASVNNNAFYRRYFTVPMFKDIVAEDEKNIFKHNHAALQILKYSDELYSTPYAEYSIVKMYAGMIANNDLEPGATQKDIALLIQNYIAQGDISYEKDKTYRPGATSAMLLDRAKGFGLAGRILENKTPEEREGAFKKALDYSLSADQKDKYVMDAQMETRFWYATVLVSAFGNTRSAEVEALMEPFKPGKIPADSFIGTRTMFVRWSTSPYTNYGQKLSLLVAEQSPTFKEFLMSVGWKL